MRAPHDLPRAPRSARRLLLLLTLGILAAGCAPRTRGEPLRPLDEPAGRAPALVWTTDAGRGIEIPPLMENGRLIVATSDRRIQEYDPATGRRAWRKRLDGSLSGRPAVSESLLVFGTFQPDGSACGFDRERRKVTWRNRTGEIVGDPVLFEGAALVVSDDGTVYGLSPRDGRSIWVTSVEARVWGRPAFEPRRALLLVPARSGRLSAVDGRSGEKRWTAELEQPLAAVAVDSARAVALTVRGRVFSLDMRTGNVLWKRDLLEAPAAAPLLAGDEIILAGLDGVVVRVSAESGAETWRRRLGGPFPSPPVADGEAVLLAAATGLVWRLDRGDGRVLGEYRHAEPVRVEPVKVPAGWLVAGERGRMSALRWEAP